MAFARHGSDNGRHMARACFVSCPYCMYIVGYIVAPQLPVSLPFYYYVPWGDHEGVRKVNAVTGGA